MLLAALAGCRQESAPRRVVGRADDVETVSVKPFAMGRPDVLLLITGGTNGRLEICSCCGVMPGGLSRRSSLVASYRAVCPRTLLIDSGDVLWVDPNDVRNDFVLEAYRMFPYDALVLGDQEWAPATQRMTKLLAPGPTAYLSTTVEPGDDAPPLPLQDVLRRQWGDVKIAVVSDARRDSMLLMPERASQVRFAPPNSVAVLARGLKADGYVVVTVVHGGAEAVAAAAACPADLIVRGHTSKTDPNVLQAAGRPMVKVGGGDWVGVVAMKIAGGRITALEYRAEVLDGRWPIDDRMVSLYSAYVHAAMVQGIDRNRSSPLEYVASARCGGCHPKQHEFWKGTAHARAYAAVAGERSEKRRSCLVCHTSGMGTAGGFVSIAKTPHLANVNCQDCHRFTIAEHEAAGHKAPRVDTQMCGTCHTSLTDPMFEIDPDRMLRKVSCKGK